MIDFSDVPLPDATGATLAGKITPTEQPVFSLTAEHARPGSVVDLDIDGARRAIKIFEHQVHHWENQAQVLVVDSQQSASNATEMAGQVKRLSKQVDDRRKEIIADPYSFVQKVNGFVKPISDRLKALEGLLKRKLGDYTYQQELQRRENERRQREAAAKLQELLNAESAAKGVEPVQVVPVCSPTRKDPTRSDGAVASTVMVWDHEVTDQFAVPRDYLIVSDSAIKDAIKAGIRAIPGVRIFERAEVRVRRVG